MRLINAILIILVMLSILPSVIALDPEQIYFLDISYDKGELKLINAEILTGFPNLKDDSSLPYRLELMSIDDEKIYEGFFEISNVFYAPPPLDPSDKTGIVELEQLDFSVSSKYHNKGGKIIISKDGQELLVVDVSRFAKYCGDAVCRPDENSQTCPEDCRGAEIAQRDTTPNAILYIILLAFFIFLVIFIMWYYKRHHNHRKNRN